MSGSKRGVNPTTQHTDLKVECEKIDLSIMLEVCETKRKCVKELRERTGTRAVCFFGSQILSLKNFSFLLCRALRRAKAFSVLFHRLFKSLFFWVWSLAELWYYSLLLHPKVNKRKQWGQAEYALEKEQIKASSMILPGWSVSSYLNTSSWRLCMNSRTKTETKFLGSLRNISRSFQLKPHCSITHLQRLKQGARERKRWKLLQCAQPVTLPTKQMGEFRSCSGGVNFVNPKP